MCADTPLPGGHTERNAVGVALAALFLLKKLRKPLISKSIAKQLTTAAQESLLRPDKLYVAVYVARGAVRQLLPSPTASTSSEGISSKYNVYLLLKGIIKTLRQISDQEHVRFCLHLSRDQPSCSISCSCTCIYHAFPSGSLGLFVNAWL